MHVQGATHNPGDMRVGAAKVLQLTFFGGIAFSILGRGIALPPVVAAFLSNNKLLVFGTLFGCNILAGKLMSTGAFEISYEGEHVWSKLETGHFPSVIQLVESIS